MSNLEVLPELVTEPKIEPMIEPSLPAAQLKSFSQQRLFFLLHGVMFSSNGQLNEKKNYIFVVSYKSKTIFTPH